MKKVTLNSSELQQSSNELIVTIPNNFMDHKIVEATLNLKIASINLAESEKLKVDYCKDKKILWSIDSFTKNQFNNFLSVNISDELQDCIYNKRNSLCLKFHSDDENFSISFDIQDSKGSVQMFALEEYQMNSKVQNFSIGKSGDAAVNIMTGELSLQTPLVTSDNKALPLSISAKYNKYTTCLVKNMGMPKKWKLNVQQFLVKNENADNLSFTYIDEDGKEQSIEEKYFIQDGEEKISISTSNIKVDLDGKLKFKYNTGDPSKLEKYKDQDIDVITSLGAPSGLKLVSSIENIPGYELVDYEPDELKNVKDAVHNLEENIKSINNNIDSNKKQLILLAINREIMENQYNLQERDNKDSANLIGFEEAYYKVNCKTDVDLSGFIFVKNYLSYHKGIPDADVDTIINYDIENGNEISGIYFEYSDGTKEYLHKGDIATLKNVLEKDYQTYMCLGINSDGKLVADNFGTLKKEKDSKTLSDKLYKSKNADNIAQLLKKHIGSEFVNDTDSPSEVKWAITNQNITGFLGSENTSITLAYNDMISLDIQIDEIKAQLTELHKTKEEYEGQLEKYTHKQETLEMQVPVHYLYTDNKVVYGFGKVKNQDNLFRLILISDAYENVIYIEYESPESNRIKRISDSAKKITLFNYNKDGLIDSIVDSRDRKVTFVVDNDSIKSILLPDGTKTIYEDKPESFIILNTSGVGIKFEYRKDDTIVSNQIETITSLCAFEKVENGKTTWKNESFPQTLMYDRKYDLEDCNVVLSYNNLRSTSVSTTLPGAGNKKVTYIFDKNGNIVTTYEKEYKDNVEDKYVKITDYSYNDKSISSAVNSLQYSTDYLADVCFESKGLESFDGLLLGDDSAICGDNTIPFSYKECTNYHKFETGKNTATIRMSQSMVDKIKETINDEDAICKHFAFMVSGWAKANSDFVLTDEEPNDFPDYDNNRKFCLETFIHYVGEEEPRTASRNFDWRNDGWQYCAIPIEIDTSKEIDYIECRYNYSNNNESENFCFTDLSFKEANWQTSKYLEENGEIVVEETSAHSKWISRTYYDSADSTLPIKSVSINKLTNEEFTTTYEYTKQGDLLRTIDHNGIVKETVYNDKGIAVKSITYHKDEPSSKFYEEQNIDEKGNVQGKVNEFGEEVIKYEYKDGTGIVSTQTDENGNKTAFGYDKSDTLLETAASIDGVDNKNTFSYTNDLLTSLKHNGFEIKYDYDDHGRISEIKIGNQDNDISYMQKEYGDLEEITTLASGEIYRQTFNTRGDVLDTYYKKDATSIEVHISKNIYDIYGTLVYVQDLIENNIHKIFIDKFGNTYKTENKQHGVDISIENTFDESHQDVETTTITFGNEELSYHYQYNHNKDVPDSTLTGIELLRKDDTCVLNQKLNHDKLGRASSINTDIFGKHFTYQQSGDHTSNLVSKLQYSINNVTKDNLRYFYDKKGNITEIRENNKLVARYQYDGLSRIIREDNKIFNKTTIYSYDAGGNISEKFEYDFALVENLDYFTSEPKTYSYRADGWKDQLMSYNNQKFEYDCLGNPTTYRDKELKWSYGRQLDLFGIEKDENGNIVNQLAKYFYSASGIRTKKTIDENILKCICGKTCDCKDCKPFSIDFYLNGTQIIKQHDSCNDFTFYYGADGITGFHLKNNVIDDDFYYKKNVQGDIIGIYSTQGVQIARYSYDAWGNCITEYLQSDGDYGKINNDYMVNDTTIINRFIAFKNPFRYRSYYYDFETNLYYLNTRYYDPETGRFINADDISNLASDTLNGLNLYAYCINNPVNLVDENGTSWKSFWRGVKRTFKKIGKAIKNFVEKAGDLFFGLLSSIAIIAIGVATLFVPGCLKLGAVIIGTGIGSLVGGMQSKLNGGSYRAGFLGGALNGALASIGATYFLSPTWAIVGGFFGNLLGTTITDILNGENVFNLSYILNLAGESALAGIFNFGAKMLGDFINLFEGFTEIFTALTIWSNFTSSYLFEKFKDFIGRLPKFITLKLS